ncbi:MAG: cache domain-containing protein, partial [Deltaproteobacteria bacterium]|nr:cache domain-containing protein [Deltaproteobacteria bacterium]
VQMREKYIARQKEIVRQEVMRTVNLIRYESAQSEAVTREILRSRVLEAEAIARHLFEKYRETKRHEEIQQLIIEALRPIRFAGGNGCYFATSLDGVELLFADRPELEGRNLLALKDTQGQYVIKDMIALAVTAGEGFYEYRWTKPQAEGRDFKKISFIKRFEPLAGFIGTGLYVEDVEHEIKKKLLSAISRIRFGKEGYLFVNRLNGDALVSNGKLFAGDRKLWQEFPANTEKIKKIFAQEYEAALKPEGDFIYYSHIKLSDTKRESPKVSFVYGIPEMGWLVGAGVYLDDVESEIAALHAELASQVKVRVFCFVLSVLLMLTLFYFLFYRLNRRLANDFRLFLNFFNRAATAAEEIDVARIQFDELEQLARNANAMVREKVGFQQALIDEREQLLVTIRSIGDAVITTDIEGKVVLMNKIAEQLTGWSNDEAKGRPLVSIFNIANAVTGAKVENPVKQVLETGEIVGLANHTKLIAKNDITFQIADSAAPITDAEGRILGVVLVFRDVTEEYQMREKLRENEQFLNSIFESIQDGVSILDPDLTIRHVNGVMRQRYADRLPLTGKKCFNCYQGKTEACDPCPALRCLTTGTTEIEVIPGQPGSAVKWIESYSYPIKNSDTGEITGIVEFFRDITARRQTEEELRKMDRLKSVGTLAGGIAHDFNNILTGLFGNVSLAKNILSHDHPAFTVLEDAEKSMDRATRLTKQFLTFAKGGDPVREDVSLAELVRETVCFDLAGSNVKPVFTVVSELWSADVDKGQVVQVFSNLTINADQAMPDGGHLYVTMENEELEHSALPELAPGKYLKITFRDEGSGMAPEIRERIFDPYFTTKVTGSGLGLATTYSIVRRHGGLIEVESRPGQGSTFRLYLPATTAAAPGGRVEIEAVAGRANFAARILVMDDEEMVRSVVERMLVASGCQVRTAKDGREAVDLYRQARQNGEAFDGVILDLTIPGGMGGKETMRQILALDPEAKGIVASGYTDERLLSDYKNYGFREIVAKPFSLAELRKVLGRVLDGS